MSDDPTYLGELLAPCFSMVPVDVAAAGFKALAELEIDNASFLLRAVEALG